MSTSSAVFHPTRATVVGGLLGGAATTSGIALTATSGWLIVRASERPAILTLLAAIVAVRAFGMARPFFRYLERVVSHAAALDDLAHHRAAVYAALVPLTPARLGRRARSRVLTGVVDDLTDVVEAQVRVTVPVGSSVVAGVAATVLATWLAPAIGLVLAGLLVVIAAGCWLAWRTESHARTELLAARAEVGRVSDLVARQAGELQAIGAERAANSWLVGAHETLREAVRRQSRGRAFVAALLMLGTAAATVAATVLADPGDIGAPVAALLIVVPVAVGDALAPLVDTMRALARAQGSGVRLDALLDQEPAVHDPQTPAALPPRGNDDSAPVIELDAVTASWTGERSHLGPIDLQLTPGRHVAVAGPNGSGKSTLLAVLARALDPRSGRHTVDGTDVRTATMAEVRGDVAVVDDEPHVFATSLRENLRLARPDATDADLASALVRAGLDHWVTGLPDGLATRLGTGGRGVSAGERTRLGVARAVLADRPVVLLDEPTAHLDHATATAVLCDVLDATRQRSVVMVSHRLEALARFDTVLDLTPPPTGQ